MFVIWCFYSISFLVFHSTNAIHKTDGQIIICVHGIEVHGRCICESEYIGRHCERRKRCNKFERYPNGTCVECETGWTGENCDRIKCEKGESDREMQNCICQQPYSGEYCEKLLTADIYSYYNHKAFSLGPLGVLTIIPLLIILYGCEYMAKKRRIQRVESMFGEQNISVNRRIVSNLLAPKTV